MVLRECGKRELVRIVETSAEVVARRYAASYVSRFSTCKTNAGSGLAAAVVVTAERCQISIVEAEPWEWVPSRSDENSKRKLRVEVGGLGLEQVQGRLSFRLVTGRSTQRRKARPASGNVPRPSESSYSN